MDDAEYLKKLLFLLVVSGPGWVVIVSHAWRKRRKELANELARQRELIARTPVDGPTIERFRKALPADVLKELREPMGPADRDRAVALALAAFEHRLAAAEPALIQLLNWEDEQVQRAAILALGAIGGGDALTALRKFQLRAVRSMDVGTVAASSVARIGVRLGIDTGSLALHPGDSGGELALDGQGALTTADDE